MRKKQFEEYEKKMNSITDQDALVKAMQENEFELKRKATLPIYGGMSGSLASIALFILTGILSGWTVGALWVVGTIMGAGVLTSATGAIIARHKYAVFNRAMRTRKRLLAMNEDGKDHTALERSSLECRLRKDLKWLNKKRLISTREKDIYGQVMRPIIARGGSEREAKLAEIQEQAKTYNLNMDKLASDIRETMANDLEVNKEQWNSKEDNIDKDKIFDGSIKISSQSRSEIDGKPKINSEGKPVFDKSAELHATSDKQVALMLRGISKLLIQRSNQKALPYPIKIEAKGLDKMIESWGADGLVIYDPKGIIICDGDNSFDAMAKDIFGKLPSKEGEAVHETAHTDEVDAEAVAEPEAGEGKPADKDIGPVMGS